MRNTTTILAGMVVAMLFISTTSASGQEAARQEITLPEAVQSALANHPTLRAQEAQVEYNRGTQEQAAGLFDTVTQAGFGHNRVITPLNSLQQEQNAIVGLLNSAQDADLRSLDFGSSKLLRSGIAITSQFGLDRSVDDLFNSVGSNNSSFALSIRIPLFRGRGSKVVASQEAAAKAEVKASLLDLNQLISQLSANAATSYWTLVAARKNLIIAMDAEQRGMTYLENVRELVNADRVPRDDLNQVTANLAQRSSNRIAAEQQVLAAQQQLMLDMGLSAEQISQERLLPADDFPNGEDQPLPSDSAISMQYYVDQALLHRSDYLASRQRVAEQGILVNAARNRLLPQIDLNLYSGYSGWREGVSSGNFFTSSGTGIGGPNSGIGIKYSFATKNQAFHGALRQAQAISRQVDLQSSDTARNISASVVIAVNAVRHAILRVKKARESVVAFQAALSGQRDRYKGGISSLVEALSVEDKLNAALSDQVQAELSYAVALTQFRFATGTITGPPGLTQNIPVGNFLTMPYMGAPEERP